MAKFTLMKLNHGKKNVKMAAEDGQKLTVRDIVEHAKKDDPNFEIDNSYKIAVNGDAATMDTIVEDGAFVTLSPNIRGGF